LKSFIVEFQRRILEKESPENLISVETGKTIREKDDWKKESNPKNPQESQLICEPRIVILPIGFQASID